jgi:hypothetical protein
MRLRHDRGGTTQRAGLQHTASTADKPGPREVHSQLAPGGAIRMPRGLDVAIRSVSGSGDWLVAGSRYRPTRVPLVRVQLDTNVLSDALQEYSNGFVVEPLQDGRHQLHTAIVLIQELAYVVQRLSAGRKRQRLAARSSMLSWSRDCSCFRMNAGQRSGMGSNALSWSLQADATALPSPTGRSPQMQPRTTWWR